MENEILAGGSKYEQSKTFLEWASLYDSAKFEVRSKSLHENWMADLSCPILKIEGDYSVNERVDIVIDYLNTNLTKRCKSSKRDHQKWWSENFGYVFRILW